jgi:hypothetical protein
MAKIPTPDRGQPLDVSYIYQIVEAVNDISSQVSSSTYKYASIDTSNGTQNSLISEMKVVAGQILVSDENITVGKTASYNYSFKGEYKYPPIVVVTPQLQNATTAGKNIAVVVESVTNSRADISVTYNASGAASYKLNIIAIGVPN